MTVIANMECGHARRGCERSAPPIETIFVVSRKWSLGADRGHRGGNQRDRWMTAYDNEHEPYAAQYADDDTTE